MIKLSVVYFIISMLLLVVGYVASKSNAKYAKMVVITEIIAIIIYVTGRFITLPYSSVLGLIFGGVLLLAELVSIVQFMCVQYLFGKSAATGKQEAKGLEVYKDKELPTVDILICTYNEPLKLVEKNVAACLNLNYPKDKYKIYVCDDGRRKEFKDMAERYGVQYITRDNNLHAKAGNINNALEYIEGDLFLVLDADMMPKKEFLEKTVGYFSDEAMGFVQTPQNYYNPDMYQYHLNKNIPNEQDFFMRDLQEHKSAVNAIIDVGTNNVYSREAIMKIGKFPTCSITEDMAVGMLLQGNGYKSVFVNETLALGLSPTTFVDTVKQRDRWCRGNMQAMKEFAKFFRTNLNFSQKVSYLSGYLFWFGSVTKMVFILCPMVYLFFGIPIIECDLIVMASWLIPYSIGQLLVMKTIPTKNQKLLYSIFYDTAVAPHLVFSIIKTLLNLKVNFNVTPKNTTTDKPYFQFRVVLPHICLLVIIIISWIIGAINVNKGNIYFIGYLINIAWSIYNVIALVVCIRLAYQKPIHRSSERTEVSEDTKLELSTEESGEIKANIHDLSEKGLGIILLKRYNFNVNDKVKLRIYNKTQELEASARVARSSDNFIGVELDELEPKEMQEIMAIYMENLTPYY